MSDIALLQSENARLAAEVARLRKLLANIEKLAELKYSAIPYAEMTSHRPYDSV